MWCSRMWCYRMLPHPISRFYIIWGSQNYEYKTPNPQTPHRIEQHPKLKPQTPHRQHVTELPICIYIYIYIYTHIHVHVDMYTYIYISIYLSIYIYMYMHVYIYTYITLYHIYIYMHIYWPQRRSAATSRSRRPQVKSI